jgi:hypothetical protein
LQKALIENAKNEEGEGDSKEGLLEELLKEQTAKEGDASALEINFAGADAASMSNLRKLVGLLCDALCQPGSVSSCFEQTTADSDQGEGVLVRVVDQSSSGKLSGTDGKEEAITKIILPLLSLISEALGHAGMTIGQTPGNDGDKSASANIDGQSLSGILNGKEEKKLSSAPGLDALTESMLAAQIANDAYTSTEQFVAKKEEKGESLHALQPVEKGPTKRVVLTIGNRESDPDSLLQGVVRKDFGDQSASKIEVLVRNLANMAARKGIENNETALSNRLLSATDMGDGNGNRNAAQILSNPVEKVLTETVVKLKEDTEPQVKDVKASSHENDYIPFSKNNNPDSSSLQEIQSHKALKETAFSAVMTEKIEKIIEQFTARGTSMDMVLRLKIDDRETLLVGLKNEGQKVMVDIKASNEGVTNILQTQKDVISRNLEEKRVYTNIYVDPDANGSFERRESRREDRQNRQDSGKTNFIEFLETSA